MTAAEYIVDTLIHYGVTDAFGIPGGVVLRLLYAMRDRETELMPHLSYHEQMAGFAACGYAQASNKLGVAYATRGPGITNMVTCIAEAYQESLPVLFLTAHGDRIENGMRFESNQELDIVKAVSSFTKYSSNVENLGDIAIKLKKACESALSGRRGPVLLDFDSRLFCKKIFSENDERQDAVIREEDHSAEAIKEIVFELQRAKRPVILIGDGLRVCDNNILVQNLEKLGCPVLSSRASQDLASQISLYYGYIGSHGTRYSNFILSKADLIITMGNRLAFPMKSESFGTMMESKRIIRLDIDGNEFVRHFSHGSDFQIDALKFMRELEGNINYLDRKNDWIEICDYIWKKLAQYDITEPVDRIAEILKRQLGECLFVCDVGNNEFWFARAFEYVRPKGNVLYSKSYGTLGVALGRAIGAHYATEKNILCVIGDQGFQYNIQELQFISYWNLPIGIILLNNSVSGMIADHEKKQYGDQLFHVTKETGYGTPDFKKIAESYKINYFSNAEEITDESIWNTPFVYEVIFEGSLELTPSLPKGNACQDMTPLIDRELYDQLEQL